MGEARRRKLLDPSYRRSKSNKLIGGRTESQWKKRLNFTDRKWRKIKPYFRVVDTCDDVDSFIDGIWVYYSDYDSKEVLSFTGCFADSRI